MTKQIYTPRSFSQTRAAVNRWIGNRANQRTTIDRLIRDTLYHGLQHLDLTLLNRVLDNVSDSTRRAIHGAIFSVMPAKVLKKTTALQPLETYKGRDKVILSDDGIIAVIDSMLPYFEFDKLVKEQRRLQREQRAAEKAAEKAAAEKAAAEKAAADIDEDIEKNPINSNTKVHVGNAINDLYNQIVQLQHSNQIVDNDLAQSFLEWYQTQKTAVKTAA